MEDKQAWIAKNPLWFLKHREMLLPLGIAFALFFVGGLTVPLFPALMTELAPGDTTKEKSSAALGPSTYMASVGAIVSFFMSPVLGAISQSKGRKYVIATGIAMGTIDNLIPAIFERPSLTLLYFSRSMQMFPPIFLAGVSNYLVDLATHKKLGTRTTNMGLLGVAFGVAFAIGPIVGGLLSEVWPLMRIFQLASSLFGLTLALALFLPESLPEDAVVAFDWKDANPSASMKFLGRNRVVFSLAFMMFLYDFVLQSYVSTFQLYTEYRYDWDAFQNGLYCTIFGLLASFSQLVVLKRVSNRYGSWKVTTVCFTVNTLCFIAYSLAPEGWMLYLIVVPRGLAILAYPCCQGLVCREFKREEQGVLWSALASSKIVASMTAPLAANFLFTYFTSDSSPVYIPGIVYILLAFLSIVAALVSLQNHRKASMKPPNMEDPLVRPVEECV